MGSPSRNVQYHPPRLSEDRLNLPQPHSPSLPTHRQLLDDETWRRYLDGLERLPARDRRLIVGRTELGYSFRQLALVERLSSPDAARMALQRALQRLGDATPELKRQS